MSRSSALRSTFSWRPPRRCSAAASSPSASRPTRTRARSAWGFPGAFPWRTPRAVHFGLMIGLALGSELAPRSIFHRKNYFYPDLPKGYQISQYDEPLCRGGRLGEVRIHRVHLEEDAAKLIHVGASGRIHGSDASIVDFNRGGTPLAEIVTEPDIRSAEQASEWLKLLRSTLRALGRQRREHGGGLAALRREHLAAPGRLERAGGEDRAQEHELVPLHRTGDPRGDRTAGEDPERRGRGDPGDAPLRSGPDAHPPDHLAALQGGSPRLPLLPRAGPAPGGDRRGDARRRPRGDDGAARRQGGAARARARPGRRERSAARLPWRARRLLRGRARGRRQSRRRRRRRSPTGSASSCRRGSGTARILPLRAWPRPPWRRSWASWPPSR